MALTGSTTWLFCIKSAVFIKGKWDPINHRKVKLSLRKILREIAAMRPFCSTNLPQLCCFLNNVATKRIYQHNTLFIFNIWCIEPLQSHNTILLFSSSTCISRILIKLDDTLRVPSSIQPQLSGSSGEYASSPSLMKIAALCITLFTNYSEVENTRRCCNWGSKTVKQCKTTCLPSLDKTTTRGHHWHLGYCSSAMT